MSAGHRFRSFCIAMGFLTVGLAVFFLSFSPALAQCDKPLPSSCVTCHESQAPVADKGEWHIAHASQDLCINCHGGNGAALDKDSAHQGMVAQPLSDIYTDCHSCHPDYQERAERFAATLGVTPGSCATPTAVAAAYLGGQPPSANVVMTSGAGGLMASQPPYALMAAALAALVLFCIAVCWLDQHRVAG